MLVYGDKARSVQCERALVGLRRPLAPKDLLAEAGELCQGLLDHWWEARGRVDSWGADERWCAELMLAVAGGHRDHLLRILDEPPSLPDRVRCKVAEGFAWYSLDPDSYAEACRTMPDDGPFLVIGIRSIGTALAAVAAHHLRSKVLPVTLRLIGHPFQREVRADSSLEAWVLRRDPTARIVIADEGPGLSGSTFRGTARWLVGLGVQPDRIHLFPSHEGLPPLASGEDLQWWQTAQRHVGAAKQLGHEISAGQWRGLFWQDARDWPASNPSWERRKALVQRKNALSIVRFAGFGVHGQRKLHRAMTLADAGYCPSVSCLRDGYLEGEWMQGARPALRHQAHRIPVELVGRYLAFIASSFPAESSEEGSSLRELASMAIINTRELGLESRQDFWERWTRALPALESRARPVRVDARLHPWEWIELPDGRWLKTDALDHHISHELPGAQDAAWDVAGAMVELELEDDAVQEISERIRQATGDGIDPELLHFLRGCYLAWHAGYWETTARSVDEPEALRARRELARYVGLLSGWVDENA